MKTPSGRCKLRKPVIDLPIRAEATAEHAKPVVEKAGCASDTLCGEPAKSLLMNFATGAYALQ